MGCHSYYLASVEAPIRFSELDDSVGCLCTFPHNNQRQMDAETVRSLAYLGAAVVLLQRGEIEHGFLPQCLPEWVRDGIDEALKEEG